MCVLTWDTKQKTNKPKYKNTRIPLMKNNNKKQGPDAFKLQFSVGIVRILKYGT